MGFCSNCIDATQHLQQNSNCVENHTRFANDSDIVEHISCTYWLPPSNSGLNYSYFESDGSSSIDNSPITFSWIHIETVPRDYFQNAPAFLTLFLDVPNLNTSIYQTPFELRDGDIIPSSLATIALIKTSPQTGFVNTANICTLSLCAREYNVSMTSGVLQSEIVSTSYSNLTWGDRQDDGDQKSSYSFTFPNDYNSFAFNADFVEDVSFERTVNAALIQILAGNVSANTNGSNFVEPIASSVLQSGLNASTNISETMDRIAAAMTNRLRDTSILNVGGRSGSMELFIRVSWLWLVLPVLSVSLGTILLISVIQVTRKHKLHIWKTSELALLFHGLDFLVDDMAEWNRVSEMEEVAMALQVGLGQGPRGGLQLQRKSD